MKKLSKHIWHKTNKESAYKITGGKCCKCSYVGKFVIHHKHYKNIDEKSIYSFSFETLYKMKIVDIYCQICHTNEHLGENVEPCHFCKKPTGITRSKSLKIKYPICRKCFKDKGGIKGNFNIENNQLNLFN